MSLQFWMDNPPSTLKELNRILEESVSKLPLVNSIKDIVPGEGSLKAEIVLVGEAPGLTEAQKRRPFVGKSGQLLRKLLTEVGIDLELVYITNIVKARPPDNRDPFPEEIKAFKPFLDQELLIIKPRLIVTLGRFSMQKFIPNVKISQVRGRLHRIKWLEKKWHILPMFHPAAALRSTQRKNLFIQDIQLLPKLMKMNLDNIHVE